MNSDAVQRLMIRTQIAIVDNLCQNNPSSQNYKLWEEWNRVLVQFDDAAVRRELHDFTMKQAREECARRGIDPDGPGDGVDVKKPSSRT
jgi:hypothetical protein